MPVPTSTLESTGADPGVPTSPIKQSGGDGANTYASSTAFEIQPGASHDDSERTKKTTADLSKRVQELELQLAAVTSRSKTMESDYSDQLRTLTEALARKSATLESTRLRASRLEFAQREAIHFLAKPLANSQDAIAAAQHSQVDIQLTECVRFALQYLKAAHKAVLDQQPVSPIMDTKGAPGPLGVAIEKATGGASAAPPATPLEDNIPLSRLATANAAAPAFTSPNSPPSAGMVKGGANSRSMSTPPGMSLASAILEATHEEPATASESPQVNISPASPKSPAKSPRPGHGHGKSRAAHYHSQASLAGSGLGSPSTAVTTVTGTSGLSLSSTSPSHARSLSMSAAAHLLSRNVAVVASDPMGLSPRESDLGVVSELASTSASPNSGGQGGKCGHCRTLALQLDAIKDALASATSKLTDVERTLDYERVLRSRVQIAKDLLETELEELTSQLFSEANRMVEEEARRRDALESVNRGLARQLERMREEEVRRTLERAARTRKVSGAGGQPPGQGSLGNLLAGDGPGVSSGAANEMMGAAGVAAGMVVDTQVYVDAVELNAFQDFVRRVTAFCPPAGPGHGVSAGSAGNSATLLSTTTISSSSSHILPHPTLTSFTSSSTSSAGAIAAAIATTGLIPWTAIDSDPLVKRCMTEDIEPCLFARTPHLHSSTNAAATLVGVGSSFKKRLMEALAGGNVDIVPVSRPGSPATKDKEKDKVTTKVKCCVCGVARTCGYSLRLNAQPSNLQSAGASGSSSSSSSSSTSSPTSTSKQPGTSSLSLAASFSGFSSKLTSASSTTSPVTTPGTSTDPAYSSNSSSSTSDAYPIDLFCRDRVLATRDFYCWIRRLPTTMQTGSTPTPSGGTGAGASHRPPIVELFRVYLAHRRRMAEVRVGSAGLFRDGGYGGVGDYANILISH
ncbi:hypothetical protein BCR44DRAFT_62130 [Catenaria anguillulae PL171]|uniref:GDP/GTP exchange factor Sec2 N-terminal domain-containing protein n=1 Tax=Catenaria anguillulae PL171 TaxID=765915 RepID=A0A1Y2HVZ3_9FUNG|nr:hypothetical protein BCR44DRAFT_62130 [Catenaria anguillulae PL171]